MRLIFPLRQEKLRAMFLLFASRAMHSSYYFSIRVPAQKQNSRLFSFQIYDSIQMLDRKKTDFFLYILLHVFIFTLGGIFFFLEF